MIQKVVPWGGKGKRSGGRIYINHRFIGRLVYILPLTMKEEKEYYKRIEELKKAKKGYEKKFVKHINKLKKLRGERKDE